MSRFVLIFVTFGINFCLGVELSTPTPKNSIAANGYAKNLTSDGLTKRGIKVEDLSGKSYDPPPEYYRGPASSAGSSSYSGNRDSSSGGHSPRPVAFPGESYGYKGGSSSSSWSSNGGAAGEQERKGLHDRISVGHHGSGHSGYGGGSHTTTHPYGPPQAVEYEYYVPTGNSHGGYAEGGDAIPVELYNRGYGHGSYGHGGGYGHGGYEHGGDYTTYSVSSGHGGGHGGEGFYGGKHGYDKALLAKSFLIPLASAAVLGIAAALASNPLLLQLGTVSSIGKRRKRELEEKLTHSMAYRGQRRN